MKYDPEKHHRWSVRLQEYDYTSPGWYFVTIFTNNRQCVFGDVVNGEMKLNKFGKVVESEWLMTGTIRDSVELDEYVIMPNHIHGISVIKENHHSVGATGPVAPTQGLKSNSLGSIIGQFKSVVTKKIRKMGLVDFRWQRNYYEHIIRDEKELHKIREYIIHNPLKWEEDRENPVNLGIP